MLEIGHGDQLCKAPFLGAHRQQELKAKVMHAANNANNSPRPMHPTWPAFEGYIVETTYPLLSVPTSVKFMLALDWVKSNAYCHSTASCWNGPPLTSY